MFLSVCLSIYLSVSVKDFGACNVLWSAWSWMVMWLGCLGLLHVEVIGGGGGGGGGGGFYMFLSVCVSVYLSVSVKDFGACNVLWSAWPWMVLWLLAETVYM